jgi:hypothetical protein
MAVPSGVRICVYRCLLGSPLSSQVTKRESGKRSTSQRRIRALRARPGELQEGTTGTTANVKTQEKRGTKTRASKQSRGAADYTCRLAPRPPTAPPPPATRPPIPQARVPAAAHALPPRCPLRRRRASMCTPCPRHLRGSASCARRRRGGCLPRRRQATHRRPQHRGGSARAPTCMAERERTCARSVRGCDVRLRCVVFRALFIVVSCSGFYWRKRGSTADWALSALFRRPSYVFRLLAPFPIVFPVIL